MTADKGMTNLKITGQRFRIFKCSYFEVRIGLVQVASNIDIVGFPLVWFGAGWVPVWNKWGVIFVYRFRKDIKNEYNFHPEK